MNKHLKIRQEHEKGKYLVVCCEGNAGFYEVGMISTPMDAGYSVLGWNHPGFGGSTVRKTLSIINAPSDD